MKPLTHRVMRQLAAGEFRSGEALAQALGVSRGSIWNAVQELESSGLEVFRVRGRGYCLSEPVSVLEAAQVNHYLGGHAGRFVLEIVDSVDSTSTLLAERALSGAPNATVIAAEWQSQGRGRRGRTWHAGPGGSLTFSLLWRFVQGAGYLAGLSLAAGVALARAFEKLGAANLGLKWPNDVLWRGGKLAGILIEVQGDALGPCPAVIGIGINVRLPSALRARIDQEAADLESACGRPVDRNAVLAAVLQELSDVLELFAVAGFAPLRADWERRHAYQEQSVTLLQPDARYERGVVRGVADDGALLLEVAGDVRRYHAGEVSMRSIPAGEPQDP